MIGAAETTSSSSITESFLGVDRYDGGMFAKT